jgi:hypothetical protein
VFARGFDPFIGDGFGVRVYRARAAESFPLTITGASSTGSWGVEASYLAPPGYGLRTLAQVFGTATTYVTMPAALRQPGDVAHGEASETIDTSAAPEVVLSLSAFQELTTPGPVTLGRADRIDLMSPVIDTGAVSQLSVTLPIRPAKLFDRNEVDWTISVADQDQPFDAPSGNRSGVACTLIGKTTVPRVTRDGGAP